MATWKKATAATTGTTTVYISIDLVQAVFRGPAKTPPCALMKVTHFITEEPMGFLKSSSLFQGVSHHI